jgi:hypothetical protein
MAFKMKGFSGFGNSPMKKFDLKGYFKGKQGFIPDYGGKPTRQRLNESTFFNPRSADEVGMDQTESRILTRLLKDQIERDKKNIKTSKEDANYLNYYLKKSKQRRPNRKNRF